MAGWLALYAIVLGPAAWIAHVWGLERDWNLAEKITFWVCVGFYATWITMLIATPLS